MNKIDENQLQAMIDEIKTVIEKHEVGGLLIRSKGTLTIMCATPEALEEMTVWVGPGLMAGVRNVN